MPQELLIFTLLEKVSDLSSLQIESLTISQDSHHVAVSASDKNVYIYNLRTRELLETFTGHANVVTSLKISSDEHFLFSAAKVSLFDIISLKFLNCKFGYCRWNVTSKRDFKKIWKGP